MRKSLTVLLILTMTLGACASRFNPMNWFGRGQPVAVQENTNSLIPARRGLFARKNAVYQGTAVGTIQELKVERVPGGAIIRVTAVAPKHGSYDLRLTPADPDERPVNGVLTYNFEAVQPRSFIPPGTDYSRQLTAARSLTHQQLDGVRSIQVVGAHNAMIARR